MTALDRGKNRLMIKGFQRKCLLFRYLSWKCELCAQQCHSSVVLVDPFDEMNIPPTIPELKRLFVTETNMYATN